ncbi:MAG: hypothetical protein ACLTYN_15240 [Dysosmobacter welbionis]
MNEFPWMRSRRMKYEIFTDLERMMMQVPAGGFDLRRPRPPTPRLQTLRGRILP